jgi:LemA protein
VGAGVVLLVWTAFAFHGLVAAHGHVSEAWSALDVQLRRRHDLVPRLCETVRACAEHDETMLRGVVDARDKAAASYGRRGRQAAEYELSHAIAGVRVVSEVHPELRASEDFRRLQAQLAEIEGEIQYARRIYNTNVQRYNLRVRRFPGSLVRRLGGFRAAAYFELSPVRLDGAAALEQNQDAAAA